VSTGPAIDRAHAEALDRTDPLAAWRSRFADPDCVYLVGNSLGMAPTAAFERVDQVVRHEWATGLIGSWADWLDLPRRVGDHLDPIIGAEPGTVIVHDSVTVNLFQAVRAAVGMTAERRAGRPPVLAVDATEFPTDRYVVAGIAHGIGATVVPSIADLDGVDVAVRSLVDYRTAELADLGRETARAARAGTVIVWDLSHAAGAVEVDVTAAGVDLAVGCSYKYLNGGPGAPGWAYVRPALASRITNPIWGWFAQRDQFEMDAPFDPLADARRFLAGTPGIIGLAAAEVGIAMVAEAGIASIAAKGRALTALALDLADRFGLASPTPRDPARRGAHVAVQVSREALDDAHRALEARRVVVDKRRPDLLRVGCSPLTTRFVDVWDGLAAIADVMGART
jgi:kynureninase